MSTVSCSCSAIGALGKLITDSDTAANNPFDASSLRHEFIYETLGSERLLQETGAITGTLNSFHRSVRPKAYVPQGAIALQASPLELNRWIPRIFGTNTGSEYLSNTLIPFEALIFRDQGLFRYRDAVVAQAVIRGKTSESANSMEFIDLIVQLIAKEELINVGTGSPPHTVWPDPEPSLGTTAASLPYTFWESSIDLDGDELEYESFTLVIDNMVDYRLNNKQTPSCVRSLGRSVSLDVKAPFNCDTLGYSRAYNAGYAPLTFALTTTGMSTSFVFPYTMNTFKTPTVPGKVNVPIEFKFRSYAQSATAGIVQITQDITP
jgi:hypothetical protein